MSKKEVTAQVSENTTGTLRFNHLQEFAKYILENRLPEYCRLSLQYSREENLPLLKHFSNYTEEQLLEIGMQSNRELMQALADNRPLDFINTSVGRWLENQLEVIDRDAIIADDIALVSQIRRQTFRALLNEYAGDIIPFSRVMQEVDRFTTASEIAAIKAYQKITQNKISQMNVRLEEQYEELLEAQELAEMGSFYWDLEGKGRSKFTPNTLRIFEMEKTEGLEKFLESVHPDDRERLQEAINRAITNGGDYDCEYRLIRNNRIKRIWSRGRVRFEEGRAVDMKGTIMDVTYKSDLLEKLKENERLFKNAEAITHIGNWSWDIESNKIVWSDEMYRIYGLEPQSEEITFERFMSLVHPDNRDSRMKEIETALATGQPDDYMLRIVTPAGVEKLLKGKGSLEKDSQGRPRRFNGTCQDVTREHRLNETVREKEEYLNLLINNAPDAIVVIDEASTIQLWNPKTEEVFGWSEEEVLGRQLSDTIIPPRYREAHRRGMARYLTTGVSNILNTNVELSALTKDGRELHISLTLSELLQNGRRSFIGFIRDISSEHRTRLELQSKTRLLEQKNFELEHINRELESFNYAASHDLQEPLRKIRVFANRITEEEMPATPKLKEYIEKITQSSVRMQRLIDDLLIFSQATAAGESAEPTSLEDLLEEARSNLAIGIEESGTIIRYDSLPTVKVIRFQFQQVFNNLLSNSIKYRKEGLVPEIKVSASMVDSVEGGNASARPGSFLKISFSDNGIGFDSQFGERMFDLFSRLHGKEKYSGTGIGLAICKKIVQQHGGFMRAESDGSNGSAFHIFLPGDLVVSERQ